MKSSSFAGGWVSYDKGLLARGARRYGFAVAFEHPQPARTGAYYIRASGEIVKVGGAALPPIGVLLEAIGNAEGTRLTAVGNSIKPTSVGGPLGAPRGLG
jgi:hypothetical protein